MPGNRKPGRPRTKNRGEVRGLMLTLRLAPGDREALDALVRARAEDLSEEGGTVSAASIVRWLIVKEAKERGLVGSQKPAKKKMK